MSGLAEMPDADSKGVGGVKGGKRRDERVRRRGGRGRSTNNNNNKSVHNPKESGCAMAQRTHQKNTPPMQSN